MMTARTAAIMAKTPPTTDSDAVMAVELGVFWSLAIASLGSGLLVIMPLVVVLYVVVYAENQSYSQRKSSHICCQRTQFTIANL